MNIQGVSQSKVQETAAALVTNNAINNMRDQGTAVSNLIESSPQSPQSIADPMIGNHVDIEA